MTEEHGVRIRRSADEVKRLLAEFENSGMATSEFCQQRGLCRSTLYRYLILSRARKKRRRKNKAQAASSQIVPLELAFHSQPRQEKNGSLILVLAGGFRIEVQCGFDEATLERLVAVLERR